MKKPPPYVVSTDSEFEPDDKPKPEHFPGKGGGWEVVGPTNPSTYREGSFKALL